MWSSITVGSFLHLIDNEIKKAAKCHVSFLYSMLRPNLNENFKLLFETWIVYLSCLFDSVDLLLLASLSFLKISIGEVFNL